MRITRDQMLMAMAHCASARGTCNRLGVGAVLALDSRPISIGYNGSPPGLPHCGNDCNEDNPCRNTMHAEHNALKWAQEHLDEVPAGCTLYVTDSPCLPCAWMIVGAGIRRVIYDREYRNPTPIDYLKSKGVEVMQCPVEIAINVN